MKILGIDPGASGAIAVLDYDAGTLEIFDMPVVEVTRNRKTKREISAPILAGIIRSTGADGAIVERVGAMPGQGSTSMFAFGRGVGMIEGVLAAIGIPVNYVTPQAWQKALGVRDGKDGSRQRAAELFPHKAQEFARKKDNGRSDATLLAYYGATQ